MLLVISSVNLTPGTRHRELSNQFCDGCEDVHARCKLIQTRDVPYRLTPFPRLNSTSPSFFLPLLSLSLSLSPIIFPFSNRPVVYISSLFPDSRACLTIRAFTIRRVHCWLQLSSYCCCYYQKYNPDKRTCLFDSLRALINGSTAPYVCLVL